MLELTVHVLPHSIRHPTSLSASVAALSTDLSPIRHFLDYYGNLTGATQRLILFMEETSHSLYCLQWWAYTLLILIYTLSLFMACMESSLF